MDAVASFLHQSELGQYVGIFESKGYDSMNYFMDLSPSKIREHAVSMEMKEGHAKRFFNAISKRKRIAPPLSQQIFTPPVVRDLIGRVSGYPLPDKLYSAQSVTAATRRHSTSLRCSVLTNNRLCGSKKKSFNALPLSSRKDNQMEFRVPTRSSGVQNRLQLFTLPNMSGLWTRATPFYITNQCVDQVH